MDSRESRGRDVEPGEGNMEQQQQSAFTKLKEICVPLLSAARQPPTIVSDRAILTLLGQLSRCLPSISKDIFKPALANYTLFPITSLLQPSKSGTKERADGVMEATMQVLAILVRKWKIAGMEDRILVELWIMTALTLGGPISTGGPKAKAEKEKDQWKGKGKGAERSDETKLAMTEVLIALMQPPEIEEVDHELENGDMDDDPLGERIDWSGDGQLPTDMKDEAPKPPALPAPPLSVLFHTLTTLLDVSAVPTAQQQLQVHALNALDILIQSHLACHTVAKDRDQSSTSRIRVGPSPLIATALPGTASTLSRIILSVPRGSSKVERRDNPRSQSSVVIILALNVLTRLLIFAVGDVVTSRLRERQGDTKQTKAATLEEIVSKFNAKESLENTGVEHSIIVNPASSEDMVEMDEPVIEKGPITPTPAWLRYTVKNVTTLISNLASLTSHSNPGVRKSLVDSLGKLIVECGVTLQESRSGALQGLLVLATDDWPDVSGPALTVLRELQSTDEKTSSLSYQAILSDVAFNRLKGLPGRILRGEEDNVRQSCRIIRSAFLVLSFSTPHKRYTTGPAILAPLASVERWSLNLLRALEFDRVSGCSTSKGPTAQMWLTADASDINTANLSPNTINWPLIPIKRVKESDTLRQLDLLWAAIGKESIRGGQQRDIANYFMRLGQGVIGEDKVAIGALWLLNGVVSAWPSCEGKKSHIRNIGPIVKGVLALLGRLEEEALEANVDDNENKINNNNDLSEIAKGANDITITDSTEEDPSSFMVMDRSDTRAISLTPALDALKPVATSSSKAENRESHRILLRCFALKLLSTTSLLLGPSFQPYLMQSLYHVLANTSTSAHHLLRSHANIALSQIAYSMSYASPQNLVLANVDYVVNSVSQRLSATNFDPSAPLVLVEMIRLVREPILPMVQSLVDDVFEALDDFHGYEEVTVGLWAVLDALMRVMAGDLPRTTDKDLSTVNIPDRSLDQDWENLSSWFNNRNSTMPNNEEDAGLFDLPFENVKKPFHSGRPEMLEEEGAAPLPDNQELPPTRSQIVAAQIMSKTPYFLSHSNPSLRSRIMSLMSSSVPLLAPSTAFDSRGKDSSQQNHQQGLLPVIHRAWPYILNRFADAEPYVVLEAAHLVEALAHNVGDFMSRRILDDVWPKFKGLLEKQRKEDKRSAIVGRSQEGKGGVFTASHRLHRSILKTMLEVNRKVPLKEGVVWDQALLFRKFLSEDMEVEIQILARKLYISLSRVNPDAVWLILHGAMGAEDESLPLFFTANFGEPARVHNNILLILDHIPS